MERGETKGGISLVMLRSLPMFAGCSDDRLREIAAVSTRRRAPRGEMIVRAGEQTDALYILISGSARVGSSDADGREVILSLLGPGDFFGEMGLIDGSPRSADVTASESCQLLVITRQDFQHILANNFDVVMYLLRNLVLRLRDADRKIESLALLDVYGRVARLLLDLSEADDVGRRVLARKFTKQDMAKMVGASREMVSRVIKDLESSGFIKRDNGRVVIEKA